MADYQPGLTADEALERAEALLQRASSTAYEVQVAALQLTAHPELRDVASCVNTLACQLYLRGQDQVAVADWQAAWGATLAAVRTALDERAGEEVRRAA